jgi:hypothetical protein
MMISSKTGPSLVGLRAPAKSCQALPARFFFYLTGLERARVWIFSVEERKGEDTIL